MKKYMPLNGLRWSRDSGSALCGVPQTVVLGQAGGAVCMRSTAKWQECVKAALFTEDRLFCSIGISFKVKRLYSG